MSLNKNFKKKMVSYALAMSLITLSSISYGMQEESPWSVKGNALVMKKNFIETNAVTRNNGIHYQVVSMKGVKEILDLISEQNDLMFFTDIDDVIIHEPTKAKARGCEFPEGKKPFNYYFPLDETVVELMQSLQEKYPTYAITAASGKKTNFSDRAQTRIEALQDVQINFQQQKNECDVELSADVRFKNSIIFTNQTAKGAALELFFSKKLEIKPQAIVMVDDGMDNLTSCRDFCEQNNIEFFGIYHARTTYTESGINMFVSQK